MPLFPMSNHQCIIIFAKAPVKGHVKTRLATDMDETDVVNLYKHFVSDILYKIKSTGLPHKIFYDPPGTEALMADWLGADNDFVLQKGEDLGERMENAFMKLFVNNITRAVIIGTDSPDLPEAYIMDAFSGLEKNDAVIGPAVDGGYYLIGFNKDSIVPEVFANMPWGTGVVFEKSMAILNNQNLSVHMLPKWRDVDTLNDLKYLIQSLKKNPAIARQTSSFLTNRGKAEV